MEILKIPHPALFKKCDEVTVFGPELEILLQSMWETMQSNNGVGLAANQVGLTFRMFTMEGPDGQKLFVVNPKISKRSVGSAGLKEGCLSAPGEFVELVERSLWVQVEFCNEKGDKKIQTFTGIHSVCVQHEMDHLDGKLHLQSKSIPKKKRLELAKKWGFKLK